ncbi:hypothetical protein Ciccas_007848 [Cichlidogyrus casuarinus]|uniref:Uncharacterized protein n=1 Tax=Cichlidogyrus casuarinus TaxID=1844966 RepID=A0ABD2Q1P2_9PLAT
MTSGANEKLVAVVQTTLNTYRELDNNPDLDKVPLNKWPEATTVSPIVDILRTNNYPQIDGLCQEICRVLNSLLEKIQHTQLAHAHPEVAETLHRISTNHEAPAHEFVDNSAENDKQIRSMITIDLKCKPGHYKVSAVFENSVNIHLKLQIESGKIELKEKVTVERVETKEIDVTLEQYNVYFNHVKLRLKNYCHCWSSLTYHGLIVVGYLLCISYSTVELNCCDKIENLLIDLYSYFLNPYMLAFLMVKFISICFAPQPRENFKDILSLMDRLKYLKENPLRFASYGFMDNISDLHSLCIPEGKKTLEICLLKWDNMELLKLQLICADSPARLCQEDGSAVSIDCLVETLFYLGEVLRCNASGSLKFLLKILIVLVQKEFSRLSINMDKILQRCFSKFMNPKSDDLWEGLQKIYEEYQVEGSGKFLCYLPRRNPAKFANSKITDGVLFEQTEENLLYHVGIENEKFSFKSLNSDAKLDQVLAAQNTRLQGDLTPDQIHSEIVLFALVQPISTDQPELKEAILGLIKDKIYYLEWLLKVFAWLQKNPSPAIILLIVETLRSLVIEGNYSGCFLKDCNEISVFFASDIITIEVATDFCWQPRRYLITDEKLQGQSLFLTMAYLLHQLKIFINSSNAHVEVTCRLLLIIAASCYSKLHDSFGNEIQLVINEVAELLKNSFNNQATDIAKIWDSFKCELKMKKIFKKIGKCWNVHENGVRKEMKTIKKKSSVVTDELTQEKLLSFKGTTTILHPAHNYFAVLAKYHKQGDSITLLFIVIDYNENQAEVYFICKDVSDGSLCVYGIDLKTVAQAQLVVICEKPVLRLESLAATTKETQYDVGIAPELQMFIMLAICSKSSNLESLCDRFLAAAKSIIHSVSAFRHRPSSSALILLLSSLLQNCHLCDPQYVQLVRRIVVNWRSCLALTSSNFDHYTSIDYNFKSAILICNISGNNNFKDLVLNLATGWIYDSEEQNNTIPLVKITSLIYHIRDSLIKESSKYNKAKTEQVIKLLFILCVSLRCMSSRPEYVDDFVNKCSELLVKLLTVFMMEWKAFLESQDGPKTCVEEIVKNLEKREESLRASIELTEEQMIKNRKEYLRQQEEADNKMNELAQELEELKRLELDSAQQIKFISESSNQLSTEFVNGTEKIRMLADKKENLNNSINSQKMNKAKLKDQEKEANDMMANLKKRREEVLAQQRELEAKQKEIAENYTNIGNLSDEQVAKLKEEQDARVAEQEKAIKAIKAKLAENEANLKAKESEYKNKQKMVRTLKDTVKNETKHLVEMEQEYERETVEYANNKKQVDEKMKQINMASERMKGLEDKVTSARRTLMVKNIWSKQLLERTKAIASIMEARLQKAYLRRYNDVTQDQQFCPVNMLIAKTTSGGNLELTFVCVDNKAPVLEFQALIQEQSCNLWSASFDDMKTYKHSLASITMMQLDKDLKFYNSVKSIADSILEVESLFLFIFVFCLTDSLIDQSLIGDNKTLLSYFTCENYPTFAHCFGPIIEKMQDLIGKRSNRSCIKVFEDFSAFVRTSLRIESIQIPENLYENSGIILTIFAVDLGSLDLNCKVCFENQNGSLTIHDTRTHSPISLNMIIVVANAVLNDLYEVLNGDMDESSLHDKILDQSYRIMIDCVYILCYVRQMPSAIARGAFGKLCRIMKLCFAFNPVMVNLIEKIYKGTEPLSIEMVVDYESLIDQTNQKFGRDLKMCTKLEDFEIMEASPKDLITKGEMRINPILMIQDKASKKMEIDVSYLDDGSSWTFVLPSNWQKIGIHKKEQSAKRELKEHEIEHEICKLIGYLSAADHHVLSILQLLLILLWCADVEMTQNYLKTIYEEIEKKPSYVDIENGLAFVGTMFRRIWEISTRPNNCYIQLFEVFTNMCKNKLASYVNKAYQEWHLADVKMLYNGSNDMFVKIFYEAQINQHASSVDKTAKSLFTHHPKKDRMLKQGPLDTQLCLAAMNALGLLEEFKFEELYHSLYNVFILCLVKLQKQQNSSSHLIFFLVQLWHHMRKMEISVSDMHLVGHMIWQMLECLHHFKQNMLKTLAEYLNNFILLEKQFYEKQLEDIERGLILVSINLFEYVFPDDHKAIFLSSKNNQHKSVFKAVFKTDSDLSPDISLITNIETVNQASREMEHHISISALELFCVEARNQAKILFGQDKAVGITMSTTHMLSCINFFKQVYILYIIFLQIIKDASMERKFLEEILIPVSDCKMQDSSGDSTFETKSAKKLILDVIRSGQNVSYKDYRQFCFNLNQFVLGIAKDHDCHMQVDKEKQVVHYLLITEENQVNVVISSQGCSVIQSSATASDANIDQESFN